MAVTGDDGRVGLQEKGRIFRHLMSQLLDMGEIVPTYTDDFHIVAD